MIINIPFKEGDNKIFLTGLNGLVARLVSEFSPKDIYTMRINKWFDHKWLRYSGKGIVPFPERDVGLRGTNYEGSKVGPVALDEQFQEQLTFPPFNPKQMGLQNCWTRKQIGTYVGIDKTRWPHIPWLKHSSSNLQNRVTSFTDSGLFVWFSSHTEKNSRGSIMTYLVKDGNTQAWYASLGSQSGWKIERVKGINKDTVEDWFTV